MLACKVYCGSYEVPYTTIVFNGGEVHVKLDAKRLRHRVFHNRSFTIEANLWSSNDIMELLLLTDAARRNYNPLNIDLWCPYFPYARQDRICDTGEALSAKVMADIINAQRYSKVTIWDAHSDVVPALLDRVVNVPCAKFVRKVIESFGDHKPVLVAPDAGARKKVLLCAKEFGCDFVQAEKIRDVRDGKISGTKVDIPDHDGREFLIVDDICDCGRTFVELAKALRSHDASKVYLYVTHGIFSAGLMAFDGLIDGVFCPNVKGDLAVFHRDSYRIW